MSLHSMTVEVTTQCSLKCVGCARTIGKDAGDWIDRHMSAELFGRVAGNLPPLGLLMLHGIGEPTLNPEYPEIVSIAARSGKFETISANTHALSRDARYYQRLVETGLSEFSVSVDSLTQHVADRTRTGTRADLLRRRLTEFADMGLPVHITMVASRFNLTDIPETLDTLNGIGAFPVFIQEYLDLGRPEGCLTFEDRAILGATLESHERWPRLQINGRFSIQRDWVPESICADPWTSMGVTVNGYLTPCCMMWDPALLGFLNLGMLSIAEAFRSPAYRSYLERYMSAAPAHCVGCPKNDRPLVPAYVPLLRHPSGREQVQTA